MSPPGYETSSAPGLAVTIGGTAAQAQPLRGRDRIDVHCHLIPDFYRQSLEAHGISQIGGVPVPAWSPALAGRLHEPLRHPDAGGLRLRAHFYRPVRQALFAAMRALRACGHPAASATDGVPLSWVTDVVDEAGRHVRGATGSYAHSLASACPHPRRAPVYGRMVLEGAIHRTVAEHATRLHQAACNDALHGEVEATLRYGDLLAEVLSDLQARWNSDARPIEQPNDYPDPAMSPHPPVPDQVAEDERFLLGVLVNRADAMGEVPGWLRPNDFADPRHEQLYRCLGGMHHRGEPIGQVTVLWEAQRRGLLARSVEAFDWLADICAAYGPGGADWLGERVARASLVRTAARTARAIRALARDETLPPGRLISHALRCLGTVDDVRARWRKAMAAPAA